MKHWLYQQCGCTEERKCPEHEDFAPAAAAATFKIGDRVRHVSAPRRKGAISCNVDGHAHVVCDIDDDYYVVWDNGDKGWYAKQLLVKDGT